MELLRGPCRIDGSFHSLLFLEGIMDFSDITLDTTSVLGAAALVIAAYGAIWAVSKVISVFKK